LGLGLGGRVRARVRVGARVGASVRVRGRVSLGLARRACLRLGLHLRPVFATRFGEGEDLVRGGGLGLGLGSARERTWLGVKGRSWLQGCR
jgi:hypothetical protein